LNHSAAIAGVQMLDLSNTLVDDADISIAVEECPELQVLKLAGCRKLTSVGEALLAPDTGEQDSKGLMATCTSVLCSLAALCHCTNSCLICCKFSADMLPFEHCINLHHALQLDAKPKLASHDSGLSTGKALVAAL